MSAVRLSSVFCSLLTAPSFVYVRHDVALVPLLHGASDNGCINYECVSVQQFQYTQGQAGVAFLVFCARNDRTVARSCVSVRLNV